MTYYCYVIRSKKDGSLYRGITNNVTRRVIEHNSGNNKSTKGKRPYELIYVEKYNIRVEARNREKYFKSGEGREFLRSLIK